VVLFPLARKAGFVSLLARVTSFTETCLILPKWELYTHRHGRFRERSESHFGMLIDAPEKSTCCVSCASRRLWLSCVHQIQMSPPLPFTNVRGVGWRAGAEPMRSAAPDRRPIDRSSQPHRLFYRVSASALGS
jgi:hypothetical protein